MALIKQCYEFLLLMSFLLSNEVLTSYEVVTLSSESCAALGNKSEIPEIQFACIPAFRLKNQGITCIIVIKLQK